MCFPRLPPLSRFAYSEESITLHNKFLIDKGMFEINFFQENTPEGDLG